MSADELEIDKLGGTKEKRRNKKTGEIVDVVVKQKNSSIRNNFRHRCNV